jgi:hypothetical protein
MQLAVTPEAAVAQLAEIVAPRTEFTEKDVYAAMADAGMPAPVADRAYKFTQIAWGRVLLNGLGIRFSPEYTCFSGDGEVIESGRLAEQPCFAAATSIAGEYVGSPGFERLALMAAEVHAVNELLNKGSKPENLATTPPALFMEAPTSAGMERARQHLSQALSRTKRPWWRFW